MKSSILFALIAIALTTSSARADNWVCVLTDAYGTGHYEGTGPSESIAQKRAYVACEKDRGTFESVAKCLSNYIRDMDCAK